MMRALTALSLAVAIPAGAAQTSAITLEEVERAIDSGRLDQARLMIAELIKENKSPAELNLVLADFAFATGKDEEALARYQSLPRNGSNDRLVCERAGIAALRLDRLADAKSLLSCATAAEGASWRAWNTRGVLADIEQDWAEAGRAYNQALALDGNNARIFNNVGYSRLLQGDWEGAIDHFERAHVLDPSIDRIGNNLELARAALAQDLPSRLPKESASAWAARLNDAGVAAEMLGDRRRAIANFTRALEASGTWYARAANNLAAVSPK